MVVTNWTENAIMFWFDQDLGKFQKVTDHGRAPLSASITRIENKQRMADGTQRRYTVAKKRTWTTSWNNIPSTNSVANGYKTADGGMAGEDIENFYYKYDNTFNMQLRRGDGTIETVSVMLTDFSRDVQKRGIVDLWDINITLEES